MGAKNKVIAGDYQGMGIINGIGKLSIVVGFGKNYYLTKDEVESYEVITDNHRKSAASGAARGLVGGILLGPVGALAGGMSAKSKGVYQVAIQFKDGKRSLIEIDDKKYKILVQSLF